MALTEENGNGMIMPVQPMGYGYGGGYGGNWSNVGYTMPVTPMYGGFGGGYGNGFGGDWSALIILFLFAAMFGGFGGGFGGFGGFGGGFEFPWLLTGQQNVQNGVNANTDAAINQLSTQNALGNIQNSITTGFSNAEVANCNRAIDNLQTAYNNQIADLNRSFDAQTATTAAINGVSSQLAKCCCDNELATANLSALVQRENCADREALSNGIRDIITAQTAGTQRILDQLCNDKIDAKNEKIQELQTQVTMQNLAASQAAQTAALVADNNAQTATLINRIAPYPQPSFIVGNPYYTPFGYGWNNNNNGGCGCGNFGGFNGNF